MQFALCSKAIKGNDDFQSKVHDTKHCIFSSTICTIFTLQFRQQVALHVDISF